MNESIFVENLAKRFEKIEAVSGISFDVRRGELFGFLGPNGAGKTTTINMLTGLARPDAGRIRIGGIDCTASPKAAQHLIGVVPDESNLYPELTGFDNLCFSAALYGLAKAERQARFRFPMIFLCGFFFPIERLPILLRPLSYVLPLTYGADILHGAFNAGNTMVFALDFGVLGAFCIFLFAWSLRSIKRRWIL